MKSEKGLMYILIAGEVLVLLVVSLLGVVKKVTVPKTEIGDAVVSVQENQIEDISNIVETETETQQEEVTEEPPVVQFSEEIEWMLAQMSVEEKVAQLFMVSPEALTGLDRVTIAGEGTRNALTQYPIGGMLYARSNLMGLVQMGDLIRGAQTMSMEQSGRMLFAGTVVEMEGNMFIAVSAAGQEAALASLIALDAEPQNENITGMLPILYVQDLGMLMGERDETVLYCYDVTNGLQSAIDAVNQGVDMLCVTDAFSSVYEMVLGAVNTGEISEEMLKQAVGRILTKKQAFS